MFGECITLSQSKSHFCFSKWLLLFHCPLASRYLDDLTYFVRCKHYSSRIHLWPCNPPFWLVWSNSKLRCSDSNFGCKVTVRYGYGWIPINTIFRGMNIHKSQLFWCELQGYKVLTHGHIKTPFFRDSWAIGDSLAVGICGESGARGDEGGLGKEPSNVKMGNGRKVESRKMGTCFLCNLIFLVL